MSYAKIISDNNKEKEIIINSIIKNLFGSTPADLFLKAEIERYKKEFSGKLFQERAAQQNNIIDFINYQRRVYIDGIILPEDFGNPIASSNPTFIDSTDNILFTKEGLYIYILASLKENGFRFQNHNGLTTSAFTRQFTSYDLRMFPELQPIFDILPVMIGDAELINAHYNHLAGFHRVEKRIPNINYWPEYGTDHINDLLLEKYFSNSSLFSNGTVKKSFELTLAFHGIFVIADQDTGDLPKEEQMKHLIPLTKLPIDYELNDYYLSLLEKRLREKGSTARAVERHRMYSQEDLQHFYDLTIKKHLEGICIVQTARDLKTGNLTFDVGKRMKMKNYETADLALLGIYTTDDAPVTKETIVSGLLGIYDQDLGCYLPAVKVNLNPKGEQIKTAGQKDRLMALRQEIYELLEAKTRTEPLVSVYDVFCKIIPKKISELLGIPFTENNIHQLLETMPYGKNFDKVFELYQANTEYFHAGIKKPNKTETYILDNLDLFAAILSKSRKDRNTLCSLLTQAKEIKSLRKIEQPNILLDTESPIILEARLFDITNGQSPFAAGFDENSLDSFKIKNAFADHIRYDKLTTTDVETIAKIAKRNTATDSPGN